MTSIARTTTNAVLLATLALAGCEREQPETTVYGDAPVERRDIVVSVDAAGVVQPLVTVEVKSKASGAVLEIRGETGDLVKEGATLVLIDKRTPRNKLSQARAELEAARARRTIAKTQMERAEKLYASRTINEVDYEQTVLEYANARADVVRAQVAVENAAIELEDTTVSAPMTGTIIERLVEKGQVISSPTQDMGGGSLLLKMADLSQVEVQALVDETDIGKISPGMNAEVVVTAYPNQPFTGTVRKIEPQAQAEQTVTTFAVLILLDNESGLLRPGMNADVEVRVAEALDVPAVPTVALRTMRDIPVSAQLVGLSEEEVRRQLAGDGDAGSGTAVAAEGGGGYAFGNRYWVFRVGNGEPRAVSVVTGITDLEYSEVVSGLAEGDRVLMLPSSGLVRSQQRFQDQMRQFTGMPGMSGSSKKKEE